MNEMQARPGRPQGGRAGAGRRLGRFCAVPCLLLLLLAPAPRLFGLSFDVTLASLTNHNTSAYAAYNQANFGANFWPTSWVSQAGATIPVDQTKMDASLNPITPGHVSGTDVHSLIPSRPDLRWFAHVVPWFGPNNHIQIGVTNNSTAYVAAVVTDMVNRGFNGMIIDWYGQGSGEDGFTLKLKSYLAGRANNTFKYIVMVDNNYVGGSTNTLTTAVNYIKGQYFTDPNYETEAGKPILLFFGVAGAIGDAGMLQVKNATGGNMQWGDWKPDHLGATWADTCYDWTDEYQQGVNYSDPFNTNAVKSFLSTIKNTYPSKWAFGSMCAKFNGTLTKSVGWSEGKYLPGSNGVCMVQRAGVIDANIPSNIKRIQWATWSDWEEGTAVESGMPNYFTNRCQVSTNLLSWTITGGVESTVDHYALYASADGVNAACLGSVPTGQYSLDLSQSGLPAGTYQLYVDAVGKPCVRDNLSAPVSYTVLDTPTGVRATAGNAQATLSWPSVNGATNYTVFFARTSGGPYACVQATTNTSATLSGLFNGVTYYLVVQANGTNGASPYSAEVAVTPWGGLLDSSGFRQSMKLTLAGYNRGSTLTNFPLLVNLSTALPGFAYSQFASPAGYDLRFADSTGALLSHEIDQWDTNGVSQVWVRVPQVASSATYITAYWGNPALTSPATWMTNGATWPNFAAAMHLKESGFPYVDSTTLHAATSGAAPSFSAAGKVGNAETFNGASQFLAPAGAVSLGNAFALSGWVKLAVNATNIQTLWANKVAGGSANGLAFYINSYNTADAKLVLETGNGTVGTNATSTPGAVPTGGWHHVLASVDRSAGTATLYVDGSNCTASSVICTDFANNNLFNLGRFPSGAWYLNGSLDEARIEYGTRSADWVWATWMNVASNSVLASCAPVQPGGLAAPLGLTASPGNSQVTLNWNPVSGALSYTVYYGTTSGGPYSFRQDSATASATVSGLTNGIPSYFVVEANNAGGPGGFSSEVAATPQAPPLNPADYSRSLTITFAGYNRPAGLTNFPVLVQFSTNLSGFAYDQFSSPAGYDLRFADANGNTLCHEIDQWNTNGVSSVWVSVPALCSSTNYIVAYWGNPSLTTPAAWTTNGATWTNCLAVFHLDESAFPYADSTTLHPATNGTAPALTASGMVGAAEVFSPSQYLVPSGALGLGNTFSLSAWVKLASSATNIQTLWANKAAGGSANGLAFYINSYNTADAKLVLETGNGTVGTNATSTLGAVPTGGWHHVLASVDRSAGTATLYVDGVDRTASSGICTDFANNNLFNMGRFTSAYWYLSGSLDEARIESGTRSVDWAWATWMNAASNSVFAGYSAVTIPNAVSPVPPPQLRTTLSASGLVFSWQAPGASFALYSTPSLTPPIQWSLVTNGVVLDTNQVQVPSPGNGGSLFYRLQSQ